MGRPGLPAPNAVVGGAFGPVRRMRKTREFNYKVSRRLSDGDVGRGRELDRVSLELGGVAVPQG